MGSLDIFADISNVGREFLALSKSQQVLQDYTWQLGTISDLIKHTHSMIVHKLEAVDEATELDDAKAPISDLQEAPLTDSFRANHLCDVFQGMGTALIPLTASLQSSESQEKWGNFCIALQERESSVAQLYAYQLRDLIDLKDRSKVPEDLVPLKAAAKETIRKLTGQMADFEALAKQFRDL